VPQFLQQGAMRRMASKTPCQIYLITPPSFERTIGASFADLLAAALDEGNVACVQLRLKDTEGNVSRVADKLLKVTKNRDVAFVLNDNPSLAARLGCDGVHIGQNDIPYAEARNLVGDDCIVGVTCHNSKHLAMEASEAGADYVAFGAFYISSTKERVHTADPSILEVWSQVTNVPCVAIGGITSHNCQPLIEAGADFLAVSGSVWNFEGGPAQAVKEFNRVLLNF
tara:strand:+ start:332 stop:1009 length:678 start_codon:yes stop_codon:yes gene_type:complete